MDKSSIARLFHCSFQIYSSMGSSPITADFYIIDGRISGAVVGKVFIIFVFPHKLQGSDHLKG